MKQWTPNTFVKTLKSSIMEEIKTLTEKVNNPRQKRQLNDANKFLELINSYPYCKCKTLGQLTKMISARRNELKGYIKDISRGLPGYQISLFDEEKEYSAEQTKRLMEQKKIVEDEINWLHKALGICKSKDYFK